MGVRSSVSANSAFKLSKYKQWWRHGHCQMLTTLRSLGYETQCSCRYRTDWKYIRSELSWVSIHLQTIDSCRARIANSKQSIPFQPTSNKVAARWELCQLIALGKWILLTICCRKNAVVNVVILLVFFLFYNGASASVFLSERQFPPVLTSPFLSFSKHERIVGKIRAKTQTTKEANEINCLIINIR